MCSSCELRRLVWANREHMMPSQEVKAAAAEAVKDLAVHEKQAVGLEEKRKHATGKAKKLKKSLHEVRILSLY